jgi:thiol-disulfide isomerase/thioredoxin
MSKAARLREQSARERIAAQQAAAKRKEARRRLIILGSSIFVVLAIVVGLVVAYGVRSTPKGTAAANSVTGTLLPASVASDITGVPAATLDTIGSGSIPGYQNQTYAGSPLIKISDTPLTSAGKPEMLYIGAEYCPYCAAMRWSMAVALSRFGSFTTPLRGIHSSATDVDPSTPTLTFYQATYQSKYLTFTPVENEDFNHKTLQNTTASQQALWQKYDSSSSGLGYPFIDFGNKAVIKYPLYDPAVLKGLTWAQVATAMHDPSSPVAKAINGAANYMTAGICKMTGNSPGAVCSSKSITSLESGL